MDRNGYLQWRTGLYKFHAETAGRLLRDAGYDDETIERLVRGNAMTFYGRCPKFKPQFDLQPVDLREFQR